MTDTDKAFALVKGFFGGDSEKALLWMRTSNPLLGGVTPREMIVAGRSAKLLKFVEEALSENKPDINRAITEKLDA
jgi:hypothetical protein